jgi:hypothetical protein
MEKEIWYLPRPATSYRGCYPLHFERRLKEILGTEDYVHFFSGSAKTGFTIDIKAETNPTMVADVQTRLPFEDGKFEAGFADPPYTKEFAEKLYGTEYPNYNKWVSELVRIVKSGGRIGVMNNYIVPRPKGCTYEKIIVVLLRIKQYPKVITIFTKN